MTPLSRASWSFFFEEFHCRGCGTEEAFYSRPRGFFEKYLLPLFFFQVVRCDRCYRRSYIPRSVEARQRSTPPPPPLKKQPESQPATSSNSDSRIA